MQKKQTYSNYYRQYFKDNAETIKANRKRYYQNHKEEISKKAKARYLRRKSIAAKPTSSPS